jgi:tetratricopeptide (TPR) repeat protein
MIAQNDDWRIRQLIKNATQACASGRVQEAERLVRQAEAEAPRHRLVLNETARRLLMRGDAAGAHVLLKRAIAQDASRATLWLNLAVALRGLNRTVEEMAAIDQVLALEPLNLRAMLQKASLHELQGQSRAAAMTYRQALQSVPAGSLPPQSMRPFFEHALQFVEDFIEGRLQDLRARYAEDQRR